MFDVAFFQSIPGIVLVAILGLLVGSFLNVVIYRLPKMMEQSDQFYCRSLLAGEEITEIESAKFNLLYPPSACPHCGQRIRFWQNIPVLSYMLQRGRCASCHEKISARYWMVEMLTMIVSVLVVLNYPDPIQLGFALILSWGLIALIFIDAETQLLPDIITLPLMWLGFIAGFMGLFVSLEASVSGAMIGYMSLWLVFWAFKLIMGKEGMGYGDFKLLAALCAFQGAFMLPIILFMASIVGLLVAVFNRIGFGVAMAFGPYLAIAGWITFMYGGAIAAYLGWGVVY
ncbi:A24 family peptidase [Cardiobacteriaceae bacterium TAE3-ERU3]|nr:A24 family peptidase [Cardiobacteriaceae bacterium TAE3-ERU3]